jgi:hypothetical protein
MTSCEIPFMHENPMHEKTRHMLIPVSKGHVLAACRQKHDIETPVGIGLLTQIKIWEVDSYE